MHLIHFTDNTYGRSHIVSTEDLCKALERHNRLVPLRHPDGTKFAHDGCSLREGRAICIRVEYIPASVIEQARTVVTTAL